MPQFDYDVFLCHSEQDKPAVRPLAERLRGAGLKVWLDEWRIAPGDLIPAKVQDGLLQSRVLLMLLSRHFGESDWAAYESGSFLFRDVANRDRRFIPVRLDDSPVPDTLRPFSYVDWREAADAEFQKLLQACRGEDVDSRRQPANQPQVAGPAMDEHVAVAAESTAAEPGTNVRRPIAEPADDALSPAAGSLRTPHPPTRFERHLSLGHVRQINAVAVSADGTRAVSGSNDNTVRVWDLSSGECTATLEGHTGYVMSVALTPDGTRAVSGSNDNTVRVWDLSSGQCTATLEGHTGSVRSVALTSDGTRAVSGSNDNTVRVWDLSSGQCTATLEGHTGSVRSVALTSDGTRAVSGSDDNTVRVWDLSSGQCTATLEGHTGTVRSVALTSDGTRAVSGSNDKAVRVWDLSSGQCTATLEGHTSSVMSVALTSDGTRAVSGSNDKTVRVWDLSSGQCTATLEGHNSSVMSVALTSDGTRAVSGSNDKTVRVWDLSSGQCTATLEGHTGFVRSVALTSNGTRAVSGSNDKTVRVWDLSSGQCTATLEGHTGSVRSVALTSDGTRAVSGSDDNTVRVWDLSSGQCTATLEGHTGTVRSVALTSDGTRAVSGSNDKTVRVWDLSSGQCTATLEGHTSSVMSVALTSDGTRAVSGSNDKTVRVWDLSSGQCTATLEGHTGSVRSVALTSDGTRAVSGSDDKTVRVWDLSSGQCTATLEGHTGSVRSVALTSDGTRAVSGSDDNTVRVWAPAASQCVDVMQKHHCVADPNGSTSICGLAYLPDNTDGLDVGSATWNGVVRLWPMENGVRESDRREQSADSRYTNAKVLLVGESGVGKTGLAQRMTTGEFIPTKSTESHWSTRLAVDKHHTDETWATRALLNEELTDDNIRREIWLWDFAGQSDYRLIHQLFMDETSLAVLVFNPQSDEVFDQLGRWDTDIQRAARRKYGKLLVAGRVDVGGLKASRTELQRFVDDRGFDGYLETSAEVGTGCDELIQSICQTIDWDSIPVTGSNAVFERLKSEILTLRDGAGSSVRRTSQSVDQTDITDRQTDGAESPSYENGFLLLRMGELTQNLRLKAPEITFTPEILNTVVGHLAAPGLVWKLDFGGFVLLQPEKINSYAAAVVRTLRAEENQLGIVAEDDLQPGHPMFKDMPPIAADDEPIVLKAMHQTFVDRGLCIRQPTDDGTQLVFPAFFGVNRPEQPELPPLMVTYEFSGFLDDVYATLVVRLHHTPAFEQQRLFRDYAEFSTAQGSQIALQLTRGREGRGALQIFVGHETDENTRVVFSRYVHEHLAEKAIDITRDRQYVCESCGRVYPDHIEVRDALAEDGEHAVVTCTNRKCKSDIRLWDTIEQKFASQEFRDEVNRLKEASLRAIDNESTELILIGHAFAIAGEAGQIFRPVPNSDWGIDGEIEFKDHHGQASGHRVYLQLKSGDSHLRDRKRDGREIFQIKKQRWAEYWMAHEYPVMLVIRTSDGRIRWLNATEYLAEQKQSGHWPLTQIEFEGEDFTAMNLMRYRDDLIGPPPERYAE